MRNMKLHTICILALGTILTIGVEAHAQLDPNMEAAVDCSAADCMFRGNPQAHDAISGFQRLPSSGGEARMFKVNRYADNEDQFADRKVETQFNAVGQLESLTKLRNAQGQEGTGVSTAFLVSPCYILTNNHAVFGIDTPAQPTSDAERASVGAQYKMKFSVGVGTSLPFAGSVTAQPVVWGDLTGSNENDWALLKLSSCVGKRPEVGWMALDANRTTSSLIGADIAVVSYPSDRGDTNGQNVGKSLRIGFGKVTERNTTNATLRYTASTAPGSSGGLIIARSADGTSRVVGMHRGGGRDLSNPENYNFKSYSAGHANEFLNITDILNSQNVRELLIKDIEAFGQPNPNQQNLRRTLPARVQTSTI